MTASIRPLSGGRLDTRRTLFFPDEPREETISVPVVRYLVEHPRGRVLFDTGIAREAATDPLGTLGARLARLFTVSSAPGDDVVSSLAARGHGVDDVTHVVNSHLHFDHCGCNRCFARSLFVVQDAEWRAAAQPATGDDDAPRDWDAPLDYERVDGEHDLFGDGAVVVLPTPGHTPGHQSLRVRTAPGRTWVMTGDACYTQRHLDEDVRPARGVVWDAQAMAESLARLRRMRDREGVTLLYSHDDAQWQALGRGARGLT